MAYADNPLADGRGLQLPPALRAVLKRYVPTAGFVTGLVLWQFTDQPITRGAGISLMYVFAVAAVIQMVYGCGMTAMEAHRNWINRGREPVHLHVHDQLTVIYRYACGCERPADEGPDNAGGLQIH
ncbi:hypothetical protein [Nocardia wallacei]|uniref:hypothetical protein n=1 Tax=Nocardia wallacei TaxID=480035 RepID=UPI0024572219|nr:hypothetical protein [Nocardia wallacei]